MCPCVGAFLHSPVPSGYCGSAGSDENTSHTCLQGAPEATPLTAVAGGGARPDGCVTRDSQLFSSQYPPTGRQGWVPGYRGKSPESWVWAFPFPLLCSLTALAPSAWRAAVLQLEGLEPALAPARAHPASNGKGGPRPIWVPCWALSSCVPRNCTRSLASVDLALVEICSTEEKWLV